MTSLRINRVNEICKIYDDSKTFPFYINGRFKELTPIEVRFYVEKSLTVEERLDRIEKFLGIK